MRFIADQQIPEMPEGFLFNDKAFHSRKAESSLVHIMLEEDKVVARIVFYLFGNRAVSGFKAPFGSIDSARPLSDEELRRFIRYFIDDLSARGISRIAIKSPPGFMPRARKIEAGLLHFGFKESVVDLNQHIEINQLPYSRRISQKERNKLNRALKEGYSFELLAEERYSEAFKIIADLYGQNNYPVTLTEKEYRLAVHEMPERYRLFGLFDEAKLLAVVAGVIVSENILYNFYHADLPSYRRRSPLVMLIGETYRYCQDNNLPYLDLGISTVEGQRNEGLFRFKENLGCLVSEKKTLELDLV